MKPTAALNTPDFYNQVPYPYLSFQYTHPDHLATLATLFGMTPPPVTRCRVLELGCASGGNIVPMAYALPESHFVGIDFSERQIADGQAMVDELGLQNIELRAANILDITPEWGQFDYVIAHGVFSWVPSGVQDKVLAICQDNLSPNGIAYISYNTYPGWHLVNTVRDLMLYHTQGIDDPEERALQARDAISFYAGATEHEDVTYRDYIRYYNSVVEDKFQNADGESWASVLHDELEDINEPLYFHEFVARSAAYGLQFVAEAEIGMGGARHTRPGVQAALRRMSKDRLQLEQHRDFLTCRSFRRTLLCHAEQPLAEQPDPAQVRHLLIASPARAARETPDLFTSEGETFLGSDGSSITADSPISKLALDTLGSIYPRGLAFSDLLATASERLAAHAPEAARGDADTEADTLAANLLTAFDTSHYLMELHTVLPPVVMEVSERPVASLFARRRLRRGATWVTSLRHDRVQLDAFDTFLLQHLDGQHDRPAILDLVMAGPVAGGHLVPQRKGRPVSDPELARQIVASSIEDRLRWMGRIGLLIA